MKKRLVIFSIPFFFAALFSAATTVPHFLSKAPLGEGIIRPEPMRPGSLRPRDRGDSGSTHHSEAVCDDELLKNVIYYTLIERMSGESRANPENLVVKNKPFIIPETCKNVFALRKLLAAYILKEEHLMLESMVISYTPGIIITLEVFLTDFEGFIRAAQEDQVLRIVATEPKGAT